MKHPPDGDPGLAADREGLAWQIGVWDRISQIYLREIDKRFEPVVEQLIARAALAPGQYVLDLGTGTGSVAIRAASVVGPSGQVSGVDLSPEMLALAQQRGAALGLTNCNFQDGRGEAIPATNRSFDVLLASLSLMYVVDRAAAAREIARVLRLGGRFVASVGGAGAVRYRSIPTNCWSFRAYSARFGGRPKEPCQIQLPSWRNLQRQASPPGSRPKF
jgi:SAM-dependent methyltransferase